MAMSGSSLEYDMLTDSRTFIISFMEIFGLLEWTNIPSFKGFHHLIKGVKQPRLIISFNTNVYIIVADHKVKHLRQNRPTNELIVA